MAKLSIHQLSQVVPNSLTIPDNLRQIGANLPFSMQSEFYSLLRSLMAEGNYSTSDVQRIADSLHQKAQNEDEALRTPNRILKYGAPVRSTKLHAFHNA